MQDADAENQTPEQQFGARVRELREQREMTQAGLAQVLESRGIRLDPSAIARLEKGQRSIRLDEAVAIGTVLDMTVDELLRPALPPEEQIRQAAEYARRSEWRALAAVSEHDGAVERLHRLRERAGAEGGDDDGEHPEAP